MEPTTLGVIGGSGLYDLEGLEDIEEVEVETPFGYPSDRLVCGWYHGTKLVFLPRHGRGHRLLPGEVPYQANIYALKSLGVDKILSVSAVGSMQEGFAPGDMVIPDQFFDRTSGSRPRSFFGDGLVAHVAFADPVCAPLSKALAESVRDVQVPVHEGGTYLCIEGPQFSTRAESEIFRQWQVAVIGMTNLPEARLAREAEMCYATLAMVTDYDCWHDTHESVSVTSVLQVMQHNVQAAKQIIPALVERLPDSGACDCQQALANGLMTAKEAVPAATRRKLALLIRKYWPEPPEEEGERW